jgi:LPS export ABC transporter protein LptC
MILFLFKPLNIKQRDYKEIPLLDVDTFVMYELNNQGLDTMMSGEKALRFKDRYVFDFIDFTDNAKKYIANMKANSGVYKNDIIDLEGDIVYVREDGLSFETQKMSYNTKTSIVKTNDPYVAYMDKDKMEGTSLIYNSLTKELYSKNVTMIYQINEETK